MGEMDKPAAYCSRCLVVFALEERDQSLGQVYCPSCTERTDGERAESALELRARHPEAKIYRRPRAHALVEG
jgi:hypothetical protein